MVMVLMLDQTLQAAITKIANYHAVRCSLNDVMVPLCACYPTVSVSLTLNPAAYPVSLASRPSLLSLTRRRSWSA